MNIMNYLLMPGYCENVFKKNDPEVLRPDMESCLFNGHKICYSKKGCGEPMVFFHNAGNDHRIWDAQVAHFSKSYEVFVVDSLGYGQSDKPKIDYTLSLYADMVAAFIEETGIKDPIIVGHCIGSAMSLHYTVQNAEKVKALILFNIATVGGLRKGTYGIYYKMTRSIRFNKWLSKILDHFILPRWKTTLEIGKQYGTTGDYNPGFIDYLLTLYKHPWQLRSLASLVMNFKSFTVLDHFSKPDDFPPVFVIWGEANKILPLKAGEDFCDRALPDQYEIIADCGHLVMREKPEIVNSLMDLFMEKKIAVSKNRL